MAEDLTPGERPPLTITFSPESETDPIKMTYGLEMDLRRLLPDPQTAMQLILSDTFTQDYVIRRCLTPLRKIVTDEKEMIPTDDVKLTSDDVDALLRWALAHAMYFFVKRATDLAEMGTQFKVNLPIALQAPSTNGSSDSTLTMPSAGDSESSKES